MDIANAETAVQQWLSDQVKLHLCSGSAIPYTLYNFDPTQHHIFYLEDPMQLCIGRGRYIAVCQQDGSVSDLGIHGE